MFLQSYIVTSPLAYTNNYKLLGAVYVRRNSSSSFSYLMIFQTYRIRLEHTWLASYVYSRYVITKHTQKGWMRDLATYSNQ